MRSLVDGERFEMGQDHFFFSKQVKLSREAYKVELSIRPRMVFTRDCEEHSWGVLCQCLAEKVSSDCRVQCSSPSWATNV